MATVTKRAVWADLSRILAIYLVLVVHSTVLPQQLPQRYLDIRIITFAFAVTCVPIFVMLSGALLLGKKETYKTFFKKRFLRLIFPWVVWTVIYTVVAVYAKHLNAFPQVIRSFVTQFESFWFLPMICGLYLLTPAIRIFVQSAKRRDIWLVIFLWFIVNSFLPYTHNSLAFPRQVDDGLLRQVINFSGYFLLGIMVSTVKFPKAWTTSFCCILLGVFWITFGVYTTSLQKGLLIRDFYSYISPGTVLLSVGMFMLIFLLGKKMENKIGTIWGKLIVVLSTSALAIYFMHALVQQIFFTMFTKANLFTFSPFDNYLNGAVLFVISFCLLAVFYKIPFAKRLLF